MSGSNCDLLTNRCSQFFLLLESEESFFELESLSLLLDAPLRSDFPELLPLVVDGLAPESLPELLVVV